MSDSQRACSVAEQVSGPSIGKERFVELRVMERDVDAVVQWRYEWPSQRHETPRRGWSMLSLAWPRWEHIAVAQRASLANRQDAESPGSHRHRLLHVVLTRVAFQ